MYINSSIIAYEFERDQNGIELIRYFSTVSKNVSFSARQ